MKKLTLALLAVIFLVFSACNAKTEENNGNQPIQQTETEHPTVMEIKAPTSNESSVSNLSVDKNGTVYLTWMEEKTAKKNTILYYAVLNDDGNEWSAPIKISEGNNWIVNWADFPTLTSFSEHSLAVNFLVESNPETYAYDVNLIISNNNGKSWEQPFKPHLDETKTEHGFVSLAPYQDNLFMAVWLDGRDYETDKEDPEMTLRGALINKNNEIVEKYVLDERVCSCCATSAVATDNAVVVVYRNRSEKEIRDMSLVYFKDGKWSEPKLIPADNWELDGCPVNGPAIDAFEENIAVTWFTVANDTAKVKMAFSSDLGNTFTSPVLVNTTSTLGRVDIAYINKEEAIVSWMEEEGESTYIKARKINRAGKKGVPIIVSETKGNRASGFPKMVKKADKLFFSWTIDEETTIIKTASISISSFEL